MPLLEPVWSAVEGRRSGCDGDCNGDSEGERGLGKELPMKTRKRDNYPKWGAKFEKGIVQSSDVSILGDVRNCHTWLHVRQAQTLEALHPSIRHLEWRLRAYLAALVDDFFVATQ